MVTNVQNPLPPQIIDAPDFLNVTSGGWATLTLPTDGMRIRNIHFHVNNAALDAGGVAASIDEIQFLVGSEVYRRLSGSELADVVSYNGSSYFAAYGGVAGIPGLATRFVFPFCAPWLSVDGERDMLGFGTGGLGSKKVQIKVKLAAIADPILEAKLEVDYPTTNGVPNGPGLFLQYHRFTVPQTSAGTVQFTEIAEVPGTVQRIFLFDENIDEVRVRAGKTVIWEGTKVEMDDILARAGLLVPQGVYVVDFNHLQRLFNAPGLMGIVPRQLPSLVLEITSSDGVDTFDAIVEAVDGI